MEAWYAVLLTAIVFVDELDMEVWYAVLMTAIVFVDGLDRSNGLNSR